jgi:hypothetical protein
MIENNILINPTNIEITTAIHENLYALFRSMQVIPNCELAETDYLGLHYVPLSNPMFMGAWKTNISSDNIENQIDEVISWFKQRNAPSFFWWTDSQTQPAGLVEHLIKRGFDGNVEGDPGMAVNLHEINENIKLPSNLEVFPAKDNKTLADWRNIFAEAFESPVAAGQAWVDATLSTPPENSSWQLYAGYIGQQPVSISILFNGAGVSGIYGVGTIPTQRNKGIGAAMTLIPLLEARKLGYHFGVLFSSRMGYSVYKRLGFHEVGNKIGLYMKEWD